MSHRALFCLLLCLVWATPAHPDEIADASARILGHALSSDDAYRRLGELCDRFPGRLSGTPALEGAVDWCAEQMRACGLENVRKEPVMVPVWMRGEESARLREPLDLELSMLGLGRSPGTGPEGVLAEVVVVGSFEELDALEDEQVAGRIVLFDAPFRGYGESVRFRADGPNAAARRGAVAALIRSVTGVSLDTPHTGATRIDPELAPIPSAALSLEHSSMLRRMAERGDRVVVELRMEAHTRPDALSHNVVGELVGRERPDEIVVVGGHLDSWDVGQGAQDDGVGCMLALEAVHLLRRLDLRPRRTLRVVLFTNEENGNRGGKAYRDLHRDELERHVAAIESDTGNGRADGFRLDLRDALAPGDEEALEGLRGRALKRLREFSPLLEPVAAGRFHPSWSGVDISPMVEEGVVGLGLNHDTTRYWDVHHSSADTFDKIVKADLDANLAALAILAHALAEMPERLAPPPPAPDRGSER